MLRGKLEKIIEERDHYKQAYQNLEAILKKYGFDIPELEKDLLKFTNKMDATLSRLEIKNLELDNERQKMEMVLLKHKEELSNYNKRMETMMTQHMEEVSKTNKKMENILIQHNKEISKYKAKYDDDNGSEEKKSSGELYFKQCKEERMYCNVMYNTNYNLYLQRIGSELAVNNTKHLNKGVYSNGTADLKEKASMMQKQFLYKIHNSSVVDTSFFTHGKNSTIVKNAYTHRPIINPYSITTAKVTTKSNEGIIEYQESQVQKLALDLALCTIEDMDQKMVVLNNYNKKLHLRLHALEKNVSYSWREYS